MNIRTLRADEIECRVQQVKGKGCVLLLYKDARCDMRILDEVFGVTGWQRSHEVINGNLFCNVDIWDDDKGTWIRKQDVGTESNTEKEKGQASDSFKRACFNIGIGRELYTAPFTWINLTDKEVYKNNFGKLALSAKVKFSVKIIEYNEYREISRLVIVDQDNKTRFEFKEKGYKQPKEITDEHIKALLELASKKGFTEAQVNTKCMKEKGLELEFISMDYYKNLTKVLSVLADKK